MNRNPYDPHDIDLKDAHILGSNVGDNKDKLEGEVKQLRTEVGLLKSKVSRVGRIDVRKQYIKRLLSKHEFPKMQRGLLRVLSKYDFREGKKLAKEVDTRDLKSLKGDTEATIESKGLSPELKIKVEGRRHAIYILELPKLGEQKLDI